MRRKGELIHHIKPQLQSKTKIRRAGIKSGKGTHHQPKINPPPEAKLNREKGVQRHLQKAKSQSLRSSYRTYSSVTAPVMPEDSQQTVEDEASVEPTSERADDQTQQSSQPTTSATVPGALTHRLDRLDTAERTDRRRPSDYGELAGATRQAFIQVDEKLKSMNSQIQQIQNLIKSMEEKGVLDEDQHFFQSLLPSVRKLDHVSKIDFKMKVPATLKELLNTQSMPNPQNAQTSAFQYVAHPHMCAHRVPLQIPLNKYLIHQLLL